MPSSAAGVGRRGARALRRAGDRRGDRRRGARHDPRRPPDARARPRAGEEGAGRQPGANGCGGAARGPEILRRPADRLRPGRQREHRRLRSAGRDRHRGRTSAAAWLHVDGAFGLWAQAAPTLAHLAQGAGRADSWAADSPQVAQRPLRLRNRDRQRPAGAPGGDDDRRRLPRRRPAATSATPSTTSPSSRAAPAGSPSGPPCAPSAAPGSPI